MTDALPRLGANVLQDRRTRFCVWAPHADALSLRVDNLDRLIRMDRDARGYHSVETAAPPGTLYEFVFPDGHARPDPASRAQPRGVHAPSMVVTTSDPPPRPFLCPALEHHVLYELHVGAFTPEGTFEAIIPRLDDLHRLGVTAIELMPVAQFAGERNWGYDGVGLFATQCSYGGIVGLRRLIDACHERGLAVVLDVVYNHLGPEGNYLREFGPYFSDRYKTPWGEAINFDGPESDHVREFYIQNALHWVIDCGVDMLRLDAVHAIFDRTARPFLEDLGERVHDAAARAGRRVAVIAESSDNDPRLVRPRELGGLGLNACWNDDYHHALRAVLAGERRGYYCAFGKAAQIAKAVRDRYVFAGDYSSGYRRRHGAPARDTPHSRFIVFTQNHDQVGNRLFGDRLDATAGSDGARVAATLVLLGPFTPMLWMGEEYAERAPFQYFVSHSDAELIEAVRRGRRAELADLHAAADPPDPQDPATFERSKLDWTLRARPGHAERLAFYTELLRLRRVLEIPARAPRVESIAWEATRSLAILYEGVAVVANCGDSPARVVLPRADTRRVVIDTGDPRWGGAAAGVTIVPDHAGLTVRIHPRTAAVLAAESETT
jgi:maltooligosyltrehalose trehalohydrolase